MSTVRADAVPKGAYRRFGVDTRIIDADAKKHKNLDSSTIKSKS